MRQKNINNFSPTKINYWSLNDLKPKDFEPLTLDAATQSPWKFLLAILGGV